MSKTSERNIIYKIDKMKTSGGTEKPEKEV